MSNNLITYNETESIKRKVELDTYNNDLFLNSNNSFNLEEVYETKKCIEWIKANDFSRIALQFPDEMLNDATTVALKISEVTKTEVYILGDTTYGSCCVDELAAEHVNADAIIHFGHACLSPSKRLPVFYQFGKHLLDVQKLSAEFKRTFPETSHHIILVLEVTFYYALGALLQNLRDYTHLIVSRIDLADETTQHEDTNQVLTVCRRKLHLPKNKSLKDYDVFYVGYREITLHNFMYQLPDCTFKVYDPLSETVLAQTLDMNKFLKRRYYYVTRAKDANLIGIIVGTLVVTNYLKTISHLKELIKNAGKKAYTIVVGKLNGAKLANFAEVDIFVNVACPESSVLLEGCKDFYRPVVSPFELEMALNPGRQWTGDYVTDFSQILQGACKHVPLQKCTEIESDVSLITGRIRHTALKTDEETSSSLVERKDMSLVHSQAAGEFLSNRSWQGLEPRLGESTPAKIEVGQKGIASKYKTESTDQKPT